ncbi:hypothetical protein NGB74_02575 [Staphylococcus chromogenes]|uniref:hypothetical protein n=1 Tax=Staphylococcus chromogenes TaxID=46126 RepID=UPI002DB5A998|nr:hypothetical protein [Staphylococcus chromogenes]MEB7449895.1 hypothetical protein [Staphylococcus chromogenes]
MAKVDYKRIWQELKEEHIKEYIMLQGFIRRHPRIQHYKSLLTNIEMILKRMDKLDGTHEFQNLLHDLEKANDNGTR